MAKRLGAWACGAPIGRLVSRSLIDRLPTALPAEVRVTVTLADGSASSSMAVLVHPPGIALPMYRVQVGETLELLTVEELEARLPQALR